MASPTRSPGTIVSDTVVVINGAAPLDEEEQLVARRTAGVLLSGGADLLVARSQRTGWEDGLPGHYFEADDARNLRREVLGASLAAAGAPTCCSPAPAPATASAGEQAWLDAAGGDSAPLQDAIRDGGYRRVVLIGLATGLTVALAEEHAERAVLVPLRLPTHTGATRTGKAVARARIVVGFRSGEQAELASVAGDKAFDVGFALRADCDSSAGPPSDAPHDPYVLLLGRWSDQALGGLLRRRAARLARRLTSDSGTKVVLLTEEFVYPHNWPSELVVRPAGSRRDLWRWMCGAVAVVDLDRWRYFARDIAEAVLCGAPVVVPDGSAAHDHVKRCGGGIWYRHHEDVAAALDALSGDHAIRRLLTQQSQARAREQFDEERFKDRILGAVLSVGG